MARKKKIPVNFEFKQTYYVYYDNKTGKILSVTNEKNDSFEFGIEISEVDANKLISGEWKFDDYVIGYQKQPDGTTIKCIIPNADHEYAFRYNLFEWITEKETDAEFYVKWNLSKKEWSFSIQECYKEYYRTEIINTRFVFFITLQDDLDFLIRTIFIEKEDLMNKDKIVIPFESSKELDIKTISISTRAIFKSYRLYVDYE